MHRNYYVMNDRIKNVRETLKLSQGEMAKRLNISQGLWSQYESGYSPVSKKTKVLLETMFSVNPKYIDGEEEEMFLKNENEEIHKSELIVEALEIYSKLSPQSKLVVDDYIDATLRLIHHMLKVENLKCID